ncbi:MAG: RNA polymerase-associated protein RapA, partial [Gammaproteobacteria bacterium HGW-Gammaproteobacteria-14]
DRAAAWFAETEDGAQALICSEIGSEGRNFQFAHHLVLFDLPRNPDLLEQRIGRLDRIGQTQDICIHIPYFEDHAQAALLHWYHDGMDGFSQPNAAGSQILQQTSNILQRALQAPADKTLIEQLIAQTRQASGAAREMLESGRDRLLEMSSFDAENARQLINQLQRVDQDSPLAFMEQVFERYGVEQEDHSEHAWVLAPGPQMIEAFPGLPEDGITVTDHRPLALTRDDIQFLSWEHPMVEGAIDLVLGDDHGKACVALLKNKRIPAGTLLFEALYVIECQAPKHLQLERWLSASMIRTLLDARGKDLSATIQHEGLSKQCHKLEKQLARKVASSQRELLEKLVADSDAIATRQGNTLLTKARAAMQQDQRQELDRLIDLRRKNPAIREEEIQFLQAKTEALEAAFDQARCQLEAVRIIVVGND